MSIQLFFLFLQMICRPKLLPTMLIWNFLRTFQHQYSFCILSIPGCPDFFGKTRAKNRTARIPGFCPDFPSDFVSFFNFHCLSTFEARSSVIRAKKNWFQERMSIDLSVLKFWIFPDFVWFLTKLVRVQSARISSKKIYV